MSAADLLQHCAKVRKMGNGRWVACCPAHEDKSPSMTVRELPDGRVLLHCFAGCGVESILNRVGLTFDALFPEKLVADYVPNLKQPFPAADVMAALGFEIQVLAICAGDVAAGRTLSDVDRERVKLAQKRFEEGRRMALGER